MFFNKTNNNNPSANLVLDFTPNPLYQATYYSDKEQIVLRVGNFKGFDVEDFIGCILWALNHEAIHVEVYKVLRKDFGKIIGDDEWYQIAGMDYLEDYLHNLGLKRPMISTYTKLHPKAFEFRKSFDINFLV